MIKDDAVMSLLRGETQVRDGFLPSTENAAAYGCAAAITDSEKSTPYFNGKADFLSGNKIGEETVANVASITKMFTAATILRMMESEPYKSQFPNGVNTKISNFSESLKAKYPDKENLAFFDYLQEQPQYEKITLRHLLQHTHGLGNCTGQDDKGNVICFPDILKDTTELWDAKKHLNADYLKNDVNKGTFGEFNYSNTGYALLGAIIETTSGKSYAGMVKEMVIEPLGLNRTYTYEDDEKIIKDNATLAHGYIDNKDKGTVDKDTPDRFTFAAGMIRSTPSDINKFSQAFLTEYKSKSMFKEQSTIEQIHQELVDRGENDGTKYGLGFRTFKDPETLKIYKGHDGASWGMSSTAMFDPETGKAACYIQFQTAQVGKSKKPQGLDKESTDKLQEIKGTIQSSGLSISKEQQSETMSERIAHSKSATKEIDH